MIKIFQYFSKYTKEEKNHNLHIQLICGKGSLNILLASMPLKCFKIKALVLNDVEHDT